MGPRKNDLDQAEGKVEMSDCNRRQPVTATSPSPAADVPSPSSSCAALPDLSGITPELEKKYTKLFQLYRPTNYFGFRFQAPLVWRSIYNLAVVHTLGLIGYFLAFSLRCSFKSLIFAFCLHALGAMGITAGAHRLWTHRSYKAHVALRFVLMLCNTLAFQNDILEWVRDHRTHHKYSETDADPHNAKKGFFFAHVGWLMMRKHPQVIIRGNAIDMEDVKADPVVMFQHRYFILLGLLITVFLPAFIPWYCWGESFFTAFCICTMARYVTTLNSTWLVNSAAHMWGNKPYDESINPAENMFVAVNTFGEGFHNYHHTFPHDYATGEFGPWFNLTTVMIDSMALMGLVWDRKKVTDDTIMARKKRTGELQEKHEKKP